MHTLRRALSLVCVPIALTLSGCPDTPEQEPPPAPDVTPDPGSDAGDPDVGADTSPPDTTGPELTITEPLEGGVIVGGAVVVKGTAADPSGLESVLCNEVEATLGEETDDGFELTLEGQPVGELAITCVATDSEGNTTAVTVGVTIAPLPDETAPAVAITAPADGSISVGKQVLVQGTATDVAGAEDGPASGVVSVDVNGVEAALEADGAFQATLTDVAPGSLIITCAATDGAGNVGSASVTVTVEPSPDETAPTVSITSPLADSTVIGASVVVTGAVADPAGDNGAVASGVTSVDVNGVVAILDGGDFEATLEGLEPGVLTITATATDGAGNTAEVSIDVTVALADDTVAPEIVIVEPADGGTLTGGNVFVSGTAVDPESPGNATSGLDTVLVNGQPAKLDAEGGFHTTLFGLEPGPLTITVSASDKAGNSAEATAGITVTPLLLGLSTEQLSLWFIKVGQSEQIVVQGLFDGARVDAVTGAAYTSANPEVASVGPDGTVTALSGGVTEITVAYEGLEVTIRATVALDLTPPGLPDLLTYLENTNLTVQSWMGRTEPGAAVVVTGALNTIETVADEEGRFDVSVDLAASTTNDLHIVLTDTVGNESPPYAFPVTHGYGIPDSGVLNPSGDTRQVGVAGHALLEPIIARATDQAGDPLPFATVEFRVIEGDGQLATTAGGAWLPAIEAATVVTDSEGLARAWWLLGDAAGSKNVVLARLKGDTGPPIVFHGKGMAVGKSPTRIVGEVLDQNMIGVEGVHVRLVGTSIFATTDELGRFEIGWRRSCRSRSSSRM